MTNRTIEKSAPLNRERVALGKTPAPVRLAEPARAIEIECVEASGGAGPDVSAPVDGSAALREKWERGQRQIAALEQELAAREQELATLRRSAAASETALENLRAELDAERENARRQGHEEGSNAAQEVVLQRGREQSAQWHNALAELSAAVERHLHLLRASAGEVALTAAAKVIGAQLADPQHIAPAIEHILRESGLAGPLTVALAPAHYHELRRAGTALAGADMIELRPDAEVRHGGCVLENSALVVDGRFEMQLRKLADIVRAGFAEQTP